MANFRSPSEHLAVYEKLWKYIRELIADYADERSRLEALQRRQERTGEPVNALVRQEEDDDSQRCFGGDVSGVHQIFLELANESFRVLSIEDVQNLSYTMAAYLDIELDQRGVRTEKVSRTFRQSKMGITE